MSAEKNARPNDEKEDGVFSLALPKSDRNMNTIFDDKLRKDAVRKGTTTRAKQLEKRRKEFEELSIQLDALKNSVLEKGIAELSADQVRNVLLMQLIVGIPAIATGLGLIIDSVTFQETRKTSSGKEGFARTTLAHLMYDAVAQLYGLYGEPDESGKIQDDEVGILNILGNELVGRSDATMRAAFAATEMLHMIGKAEDPRMFAGEIEDPKTKTKIQVDDIFDSESMELFKSENVDSKPKKEKIFDEREVLTDEEAYDVQKRVRVNIEEQMKGIFGE